MTPKEKANELVNKYKIYLIESDSHAALGIELDLAQIAVDEIINSSPSAPILSDAGSFVNDIEESTEFWQEVKKEIEKL